MNTTGIDKEDLDLILESLRDFAKDKLPDEKLLEWDEKDECPEEVVRAIFGEELGLQLVFIPEDCEGMGGGAYDVYRVCHELGRIDLGVATGILATFLGADPIMYGGTDEQKKRWMSQIALDGYFVAYGATEAEAGSDLANLRSTAVPVEEDGKVVGYKINGSKQWISNGGFADLITILANTSNGPCWFVVEKGTEGFEAGNPEDKHGIRLSNTAALTLDDVYVDADHLIGGVEGQGLIQAQMVFGYTRLMVAAFGLGGGWSALDRAIEYSKDRIQAGTPLSEKQGFTHKLIIPHLISLEAGRAYIEETAERIDSGAGNLNTEGAIAKYLATEAGNRAADASIQALGGYGYTKEYMVEKIKRDVRITTIYEGTSEIMEMTICRDRWQFHLKTRGDYYHEQARQLETLQVSHPDSGAGIAALGLHALAEVLEKARLGRLTRNQHILFRLGELIAYGEGARSLVNRAIRYKEGKLDPKTDTRFKPEILAAISRAFAKEAALKIAQDGIRWVGGASPMNASDMAAFTQAINFSAIHAAQVGLMADMDKIADAVYEREG